MSSFTRGVTACLLLAAAGTSAAQLQETDDPATVGASAAQLQATDDPATVATPAASQSMGMDEIIKLLQQQQKDLAEQRALLKTQSQEMLVLRRELDVLRKPAAGMSEEAISPTGGTRQPVAVAIAADGDRVDQPKTVEEKKEEAGVAVAEAQADDPTRALLDDFKGAWRLPGTNAALGIGGYVKASIVYNYDALEVKDRFIVGSIPVDSGLAETVEAQSSITASQSRLNFDLREPTDVGLLRAFIEGDFAEEGDTFRLRHAFGQWNKILAGKTWSAFVDTDASPEEVDFEGLNGRVSVRQSQVRIMPQLGSDYEFQFSLEDPNPQVQNGVGVTRAPDIVASARFQPSDRLHLKLGLLGRQIRAQRINENRAGVEKQYAWGVTVSGRFRTPALDARDSLLFQLNAGDGIGRYINDLASVGRYDGIFNPVTGDLKLFRIIAGYMSWQHWWGGTRSMRSNFTLGAVDVDNPKFLSGSAYKQTLRASTNLFWSPTPRIDIGAEYLWGKRKNEDGGNGDATQLQLAARYRF